MENVSLTSFAFWKKYILVCRPHLFFVAGTSALAGLSIDSGQDVTPLLFPAFILFVLVAVFYGLYRGLSYDSAMGSNPKGPLVKGEVDESAVIMVSSALIVLCTLALSLWNVWNLPLIVLIIVGSIVSAFITRYWWGSLFFKPAVLALVPVISALTISKGTPFPSASLLWLVLSVFLSSSVFILLDTFGRIDEDRRSGYSSLPIMAGRKLSILISLIISAFAFFASITLLGPTHILEKPLSWAHVAVQIMWAAGFLILFYLHYSSAIVSEDQEISPDARGAVRALVLIRCGEAAAYNPGLVPVVLLTCIFFELSQLWEQSEIDC